jgi:hypothetical protein
MDWTFPPMPHVLVLDTDVQRRQRLATALRQRGFGVSVASSIADLERWPSGQIVVVDAARFTPWWATVGAVRVLVLSDSEIPVNVSCEGVPCTWIPHGDPDSLIAAM